MSSILDCVLRLLTSWKSQHHQPQLDSPTEQIQEISRESSTTTTTSNTSDSSSLLNQNEFINLNSYPSQYINLTTTPSSSSPQQPENHFYYAISQATRSSLAQQNSNTSSPAEMSSNFRISFGLPNRRRSNRSRASGAPTPQPTAVIAPTASSRSSTTSSSTASTNNYDFFSVLKKRERNLLSAVCAVFCIAVLSVSLVETRWFFLNGGGCNINYVGVAHFFAPGRLEYQIEISKMTKSEILVYNFVLPNGLG